MTATAFRLSSRSVISVSGEDARDFLQGVLTNDIYKLAPDRALYSALLTPQGKFLYDFLIAGKDGALLFDCDGARADGLLRKLMMYRLRAKAAIDPADDSYAVWALTTPPEGVTLDDAGAAAAWLGGVVYRDPRMAAVGCRALLPVDAAPEMATAGEDAYHVHRIACGLPDGARDMEVEKTLALEGDLDVLNGVDFNKGCYVGQELTARTKYRGKLRRRLVPLDIPDGAPDPGTPVELDGKAVGDIRSAAGAHAIAMLRTEALAGGALTAGGRAVTPRLPDWLAVA